MQNGFFDELLKEEENKQNKVETIDEIQEAKAKEEGNVETFNFSDFAKQEPKEEVKAVVEPPLKSKETSQTSQISQEVNKKVENINQPKQSENKPNVENVKTSSNSIVKKDFSQALIENTLNKIADIVTYSNETFTPQAKIIACDIITSLDHTINERGFSWQQIDAKGSGLIMQIKKWAKLGVDCSTDKLYADIRKNGNTGLYDIKVKGQYQTVEKLMIQYCKKKITNFKTEVICIGDELKTHFNYETGEEKIIDFIKDEKVNRNLLDNIIGAFKIAYYEDKDGSRKQIVTIIEKERIMSAYNAATTKNVWKSYTQKMVLKTVTWEMFNGENIRPFMDYPTELMEDLKIVNENEDIDFNKEHKYHDVVDADAHATETLGVGEDVSFD